MNPREESERLLDLQAFDELIEDDRERDERDCEKSSQLDRKIEAIEWSKP
jgi:hypothetical protein